MYTLQNNNIFEMSSNISSRVYISSLTDVPTDPVRLCGYARPIFTLFELRWRRLLKARPWCKVTVDFRALY